MKHQLRTIVIPDGVVRDELQLKVDYAKKTSNFLQWWRDLRIHDPVGSQQLG